MVPLFLSPVAAGFPSPADDFLDHALDLNELLVEHPTATFFVRVKGNSMIGAGMHSGDILVVDRSLEAKDKSIIVALVNNEFTVKRLVKRGAKVFLMPENSDYLPIEINDHMDFEVWGVVRHVIHSV
jgi:DNA polymerase V